jgi:hypothetical protein
MRRGVRNVTSAYARTATSDAAATASTSAEPGRPTVSADRATLTDIAGQIRNFAEGLTAANRMCEDTQALMVTKFEEATAAIAAGKAEAVAESKAATAHLQQQIAQRAGNADLINPGNEAQYTWNCSVLNLVTEALTCIENDDTRGARLHLRNAVKAIMVRNKHIKMADASPAGWGMVREYLNNGLADDDADDAKMRRAETAALAKKKRKAEASQRGKTGGRGRGRPSEAAASAAAPSNLDPFTWALLQNSVQQYTVPAVGAPVASTSTGARKLGPCYTCQGPHLQKDCPVYKAQNAAIQAHLAAALAKAPGNSK